MAKVYNRKQIFKIISTVILVCVIASALIGLSLLFKIIGGSTLLGKIMLTLLTTFIAGLFMLNSINALTSGNKLGLVAFALIAISALLFYILIWVGEYFGDFYKAFTYIVVIVSMASILLNLIIGNYISLKWRLLGVQIPFYVAFAYIQFAISCSIFGNSYFIGALLTPLIAVIIVTFTLFLVLEVKKKNLAQTAAETADAELVKIPKAEYDALIAELEEYRNAARVKSADGETEENA